MHSVFPTRSHNLSGHLKGAELREKRTQAKWIMQTAPHGTPWAFLSQLSHESATNAFRFQSAFSSCFIGFHFFKMWHTHCGGMFKVRQWESLFLFTFELPRFCLIHQDEFSHQSSPPGSLLWPPPGYEYLFWSPSCHKHVLITALVLLIFEYICFLPYTGSLEWTLANFWPNAFWHLSYVCRVSHLMIPHIFRAEGRHLLSQLPLPTKVHRTLPVRHTEHEAAVALWEPFWQRQLQTSDFQRHQKQKTSK